jgi:hypothetical protein
MRDYRLLLRRLWSVGLAALAFWAAYRWNSPFFLVVTCTYSALLLVSLAKDTVHILVIQYKYPYPLLDWWNKPRPGLGQFIIIASLIGLCLWFVVTVVVNIVGLYLTEWQEVGFLGVVFLLFLLILVGAHFDFPDLPPLRMPGSRTSRPTTATAKGALPAHRLTAYRRCRRAGRRGRATDRPGMRGPVRVRAPCRSIS